MACDFSTVIEVYRGNTVVLNLAIEDNGVALDITGWTLKFTIKRSQTDVVKVLQYTTSSGITITDAANGIAVLTIPSADTATLSAPEYYYFDVSGIDTNSLTHTLSNGMLFVQINIT